MVAGRYLSLAACLGIASQLAGFVSGEPGLPTLARRPVAAVALDGGRLIAVANERSGSISFLDVANATVLQELPAGKRLTSLAASPDGKTLLATAAGNDELLFILRAPAWAVAHRLKLPAGPANVVVARDGLSAWVVCQWSWQICQIDLRDPARPRRRASIAVPFAPRLQLLLPDDQHLLVADAFGGHLAIVDLPAGKLLRSTELPLHNIGGLALSADAKEVLLTHQRLDQALPTTKDNITRGLLVENLLRKIPVASLLNPKSHLLRESSTIRLGAFGAGAGDPAGVAVINATEQLVAFAGVDEVAVVTPNGSEVRLPVPSRPTAVITLQPGSQYAVLCTLDDSVTLVSHASDWRTRSVSLGPRPPLTSAERGERLFFDARLSAEHWLSCHSCHVEGHTNGLRADTRGDQSFGAPKRVLTLLGTALTDKWAWNGDIQDLDVQVAKSLATTIHSAAITSRDAADLTTFLHKLPHPPPRLSATEDAADRAQLRRGEALFQKLDCGKCHIPPRTYTSHGVVDVGLADELGQSKFNPPSLRGVSQGYRFFHDNRASSLEAVFIEHGHQLKAELSADDLAALVRFLKSL